jgi:hypothetical protein
MSISPNAFIQGEYDNMTKTYDLNYPSKYTLETRNSTNFIPVHSSSTQNSIFWKKNNEDVLHNLITLVDHKSDLSNIGGFINETINNTSIDNLLNQVEVEEIKKKSTLSK